LRAGHPGFSGLPGRRLSLKMRAALSQAVQEFGQHLVGRNYANFSNRLPRANYLGAILIVCMKRRTPVQRVCQDELHFFFGAPRR
jgi:hypothetical protein